MTPEEIRRLEAVADRAWPAAETVAYDGWELRATGPGIGRRVNSAATPAAGTLPLEQKIAFVEAFYRRRGLAPTFKLTTASQPLRLEAALTGAGYHVEGEVSLQTRALPFGSADRMEGEVRPDRTRGWEEVNSAAGGHWAAAPAAFAALLQRIEGEVGFVTLTSDRTPAAAGLAVAGEGTVGIFEIGTHPNYRRRGLGRRLVHSLLAWGAARGAELAYLQVMTANDPALALYATLGFREAYRYWYRVAPPNLSR